MGTVTQISLILIRNPTNDKFLLTKDNKFHQAK